MADPLDEFNQLISQMYDELTPVCDAFKHQFSAQGEGLLRYLLALYMMEAAIAGDLGIPVENLHDFTRKTMAMWFRAGRPSDFLVVKMRVEEEPKGKPN